MQSEELCEGELININEESGYNEKDEDVPEVTPVKKKKKNHIKELLDIFHDIQNTMDKMLEGDPN